MMNIKQLALFYTSFRFTKYLHLVCIIVFICISFLFAPQTVLSLNAKKEDQALKLIYNLRNEKDFVERAIIEAELIGLGSEIMEILISVLDEELDKEKINREFVISVIKALSENRNSSAVDVLVRATYIIDWIVREEAVYALTETINNNVTNLEMLIAALGANDTYAQDYARNAILDIKSHPGFTESLIEAMQTNKNETARIQIIDIISKSGGDKVADYLFSLLDDYDEKVRKETVKALHKIDVIWNEADKDTLLKILNIIKDDITFHEIWNETIKKLNVSDLNDINFLIEALHVGNSARNDNLKKEVIKTIISIGKPALNELNTSIKDAIEGSSFYSNLVDVKSKIEESGKSKKLAEISVPILTDRKMGRSKHYDAANFPVTAYVIIFFCVCGGIWLFSILIFKLIRFHWLRGRRWVYRDYEPHSTSYYKVPSTHVNIRGLQLKYMAEASKEGCNLCGKFDFSVIGKVVINTKELLIVQCKDDGLIWRTPLLTVPVLRDFFGKLYYRSPYPEYFGYVNYEKMKDERMYMAEKELKLINDFRTTDSKSKNRLLDIGCGAGDFIAKAHDDGWEVRGTEISTYAVKNIIPRLNYKMLQDDKNVKRVYHTTLAEFVAKNRIKKMLFDVITVFEVLEVMHDPQAFLALTKEVLNQGGRIFVGISAPKGISQLTRLAENQFHISEKVGMRMIEKAGFKIISTKSISKNERNHGKILIAEYPYSESGKG